MPISKNTKLERLRQLRQFIIDFQDQFNYSRWQGFKVRPASSVSANGLTINGVAGRHGYEKAHDISHDCNTTGCVAGFAVGCMSDEWIKKYTTENSGPYEIPEMAQEWLGLSDFEHGFLFLGDPYTNVFEDLGLESDDATPEEAIRRLDQVILCTDSNIDMYLAQKEYIKYPDDESEDDYDDNWDDDDWDDDDSELEDDEEDSDVEDDE
jgi:hypothetical protein